MIHNLFESSKIGRGTYKGSWLNFEVEDGLPTARVCHVTKDRDGYLWFSTLGGGVFRYNGCTLTLVNSRCGLPVNEVKATYQDRAGDLWFATTEGAARYDGRRITTYTVDDGLSDNRIQRICQGPEGDWWFYTSSHVNRYDGHHFTTPTTAGDRPFDWVCPLSQDPDELWLGTGEDLYRYDGQNYTHVSKWKATPIFTVCRDRNGHLWFGGFGGVRHFDGERVSELTSIDGLADCHVMEIFRDRDDDLWFTTYGKGIRRYDGHTFSTLTPEDGLRSAWVSGVQEDREGHFWFATESGISRYSPSSLSVLTTADGLADNGVMTFVKDQQERLWIGTWKGVSYYDADRLHTLEQTRHMNVWDLQFSRQGQLWFASLDTSVGRIENHTPVAEPWAELGDRNMAYTIYQDSDDQLWVGTYRGLGCYDGNKLQFFTAEDGLGADIVRAIHQDRQGLLWIGTYGGGLCRYDGRRFTSFTTQDGLCDNAVLSLYEDRQGLLWIGTMGGLCRYDGRHFTSFTTQDGLCNNAVLSLYEDSQGLLWIGTFGGGLCRYDGRIFQALTRRHGLPDNTIQQIGEDGEGTFWIATEGGLVRYRAFSRPPTIAITLITADRVYEANESILLSDSHKLFRINFEGSSFTTHFDDLAYLCYLRGARAEEHIVRQDQIEFHNLPVGNYTFSVQAVDQDLNYSEPAHLSFEIVADPLVQSLTHALGEGQSQAFITSSSSFAKVQASLAEVAPLDITVLITGETGVGKGVAARVLHKLSNRCDKPFIQVNCGALPEGLVESELFGHEKGAFTGAVSRKIGKVELAADGTLFLDEIGDLSLQAQVKILHLLQEHTFERVGGTQELTARLRLVAATNRNLEYMVDKGTFRQDLYFRLRVFPIDLPPLRQRREDIPLLATYFSEKMAAHLGKQVCTFSPAALAAMQTYTWPGNVRELEHAVQRAIIVCQAPSIQPGDLLLGTEPLEAAAPFKAQTLEEHERHYIQQVLEEMGTIRQAAEVLGVPPSTLQGRIKKLGIERGK